MDNEEKKLLAIDYVLAFATLVSASLTFYKVYKALNKK
jgi:hypothetical protein